MNIKACRICHWENPLNEYGICENCMKVIRSEGTCINCGKSDLYKDTPFCYYCFNIWRQAVSGLHEKKFRDKGVFRITDECQVCHREGPIFAPRARICADCSESMKKDHTGWCAWCHQTLTYNSPVCKSCLDEYDEKNQPDHCVDCGSEEVYIKSQGLCRSCYVERLKEQKSYASPHRRETIQYYLEEARKLYYSRRLLDIYVGEDVPLQKRLRIPELFNIEAKAHKRLGEILPEEVFEKLLLYFRRVDTVKWNSLFKLILYHILNGER
jgi:hypothetical protein